MSKKNPVNIPVIHLKEGETFICYSPAFDLVTHGDSFADAEGSFFQTLELLTEEITRRGNWREVLVEYGWGKVGREWNPPRIIGQNNKGVKIPAFA